MFPVRSFYLLAILFYFGTTIILRLGASDRNPLPILGAAILVAMSVIYFITIAPKLRPLLRLNLFQSLFVFSVLFNAYFFIDLFYGHYTAADSGELHGRKLRCFVIFNVWVISFTNFFRIGYSGGIKNLKTFAFFLFAVSAIMLAAEVYSDLYTSQAGEVNVVAGYALICVLPLVLFLNKQFTLEFVLITAIFTAASGKRGAILAICAIILVFLVIHFLEKKEPLKRNALLIRTLVLFPPIVCGIYLVQNIFLQNLTQRMTQLLSGVETSDGSVRYGSGRSNFWLKVFEGWNDSTVFNKIFGLGFFSTVSTVQERSGPAIYAHNDYLETLHNFGILGLSLFLIFSAALIRFTVRVTKRSALLVGSIIIIGFLARSFFSGILYRTDTILFAVSSGLVLGFLYRERIASLRVDHSS